MKYTHIKKASPAIPLSSKLMSKVESRGRKWAKKKLKKAEAFGPDVKELASRIKRIQESSQTVTNPQIRKIQLAEAASLDKQIQREMQRRQVLSDLFRNKVNEAEALHQFKKLPGVQKVTHVSSQKSLSPFRPGLHEAQIVNPLKASLPENISVEPIRSLPTAVPVSETPGILSRLRSSLAGRVSPGESTRQVEKAVRSSRKPLSDVEKARVSRSARYYEGKKVREVAEDIPRIEKTLTDIDQRLASFGVVKTNLLDQKNRAQELSRVLTEQSKQVNRQIQSLQQVLGKGNSSRELQALKYQKAVINNVERNIGALSTDIQSKLDTLKQSTEILEKQYKPEVLAALSTAKAVQGSSASAVRNARLGLAGLGSLGVGVPASIAYSRRGGDPLSQIEAIRQRQQAGDAFVSDPVSDTDPSVEEYFKGIG